MNRINVADIANQLAADGELETEALREVSFSLQVMRFEPGDEDHMHAHAEEEIYRVDRGEATLVTDEESMAVGPDDLTSSHP